MKPAWAMVAAGLTVGLAMGVMAAAQKPADATQATLRRPAPATQPQELDAGYVLVRTLQVEMQDRQWGQMQIDAERKLLYVAKYGKLLVLDSATGKTVTVIGGGDGKLGVVLVPEAGRGFVSNSRDATVTVFDLASRKMLGTVAVGDGPGPMIYDPMSKRVLVCCVRSWTLVPLAADMDLKTGKPERAIKLPSAPVVESTIAVDGRGMAYVALDNGGKGEVAVVDTREMRLATTWPVVLERVPSTEPQRPGRQALT